jgi:eukaryotic-like serine/threonine-protein kinase
MTGPDRRVCPDCRGPIPAGAPLGWCPRCWLQGALEVGCLAPPVGSPLSWLAPDPPAAVRDYVVLAELGRGGMGVVYLARRNGVSSPVALKRPHPGASAEAGLARRLRAEGARVARLHHHNIVSIHEVGEAEEVPFMAMEYVSGVSLDRLVGAGPLPAGRAVRHVAGVARAVQHAHDRGILHLDLKPSNVIIDGLDEPHLVDFAVAISSEGCGDPAGAVCGSPHYMAPEQWMWTSVPVGPAADVHGLGALLYHLLTGRPPFEAPTLPEVILRLCTEEVLSPRQIVASLPAEVERICLCCLRKEARERYSTAGAVADELECWLAGGELSGAQPAAVLPRTAGWRNA